MTWLIPLLRIAVIVIERADTLPDNLQHFLAANTPIQQHRAEIDLYASYQMCRGWTWLMRHDDHVLMQKNLQ